MSPYYLSIIMSEIIKTMSTDVLEAKQPLLSENDNNRCEDCPEINPDPPVTSDCPNFEIRSGGAVCNREDGLQKELERFLARTGF